MLNDLIFKIVVIDDISDSADDYIEVASEKLKSEGFLIKPEKYETLEEVDERLGELEKVDLFLIDLKFGNEDKGPEFIKKIREKYLTDILFYSSDVEALKKIKTKNEYEGLFFSVRSNENTDILERKICSLIDKAIKHSDAPLLIRGVILGSVAILDDEIKKAIEKLSTKYRGEKNELIDSCVKIYYDSNQKLSEKRKDFFGYDFFPDIKTWNDVQKEQRETKNDFGPYEMANSSFAITDSNKNLKILNCLYNLLYGSDFPGFKNLNKLLMYRNVLAHEKVYYDNDIYYKFRMPDGEFVIFNEEQCKKLRKLAIDCYNKISSIE